MLLLLVVSHTYAVFYNKKRKKKSFNQNKTKQRQHNNIDECMTIEFKSLYNYSIGLCTAIIRSNVIKLIERLCVNDFSSSFELNHSITDTHTHTHHFEAIIFLPLFSNQLCLYTAMKM